MLRVQDFPSTVHWYKPWWSHGNCRKRGDKSYPASRWTCSGLHRQWSGFLQYRWTRFLEVYSGRSRSSRSRPCHSPHIHTTLGLRRHQVEVIFWAGQEHQRQGCFPGEQSRWTRCRQCTSRPRWPGRRWSRPRRCRWESTWPCCSPVSICWVFISCHLLRTFFVILKSYNYLFCTFFVIFKSYNYFLHLLCYFQIL